MNGVDQKIGHVFKIDVDMCGMVIDLFNFTSNVVRCKEFVIVNLGFDFLKGDIVVNEDALDEKLSGFIIYRTCTNSNNGEIVLVLVWHL